MHGGWVVEWFVKLCEGWVVVCEVVGFGCAGVACVDVCACVALKYCVRLWARLGARARDPSASNVFSHGGLVCLIEPSR